MDGEQAKVRQWQIINQNIKGKDTWDELTKQD